jgi:hypothetical protein
MSVNFSKELLEADASNALESAAKTEDAIYGLPLEYYGEFGGAPWPVSIEDEFYRRPGEKELSVQERIAGLGFEPEYFVITHFDLFHRHHQDLQAYLEENCEVLAQTESYLIYNSCHYLDFEANIPVAHVPRRSH